MVFYLYLDQFDEYKTKLTHLPIVWGKTPSGFHGYFVGKSRQEPDPIDKHNLGEVIDKIASEQTDNYYQFHVYPAEASQ